MSWTLLGFGPFCLCFIDGDLLKLPMIVADNLAATKSIPYVAIRNLYWQARLQLLNRAMQLHNLSPVFAQRVSYCLYFISYFI